MQVSIPKTPIDTKAVTKMLPLIYPSHRPALENISPALQSLLTYLAKTPANDLVTTLPHSQGKWQVEKVYVLDDCVAAQMGDGHYLETIFFVQALNDWRIVGRVRPQDHK